MYFPVYFQEILKCFHLIGIVASLTVMSCRSTETSEQQTATSPVATDPQENAVVKRTITNEQGKQLDMTFDNSAQSATLVLNDERIDLRQDTVASGIKYSNGTYEYREHQGVITLTKAEKLVFANKP